MKTKTRFIIFLILFFGLAFSALANDFVLSPGKVELFLNPGESITKEIFITNRLGQDVEIKIEVEDFSGSDDPQKPIILSGADKGSYSLKDYIKLEGESFKLKSGEQKALPVEISIPKDAEPGGLYGGVFVSFPSIGSGQGSSEIGAISRLGTLFFVKVGEEVINDGFLKKFDTKLGKSFFEKGPINFEIVFENNGNVHLVPYGEIEIKNLFGVTVKKLEIDPWFVMPDALRAREIKWNKDCLFGRYAAHLKINRGYENIIDEAQTSFWVIPWKIILAVLFVVFVTVFVVRGIFRRFEIRKK